MSVTNFDELEKHYGHDIVVARYTTKVGEVQNVGIECNDCWEILIDYDKESNE